jgi:hypothetical protein
MINIRGIKNEFLWFLRNENILSKEIRGVSTQTITEVISEITTFEIDDLKVKNIRQIKLGSTILKFGIDYNYSTDGNALITFNTAKSGNLEIIYDTGLDKIFPDYPRDDLSLESYPRIGFDIIAINTQPAGINGEEYLSELLFSLVVYAQKNREVEDILDNLRSKIINNAKNFIFSKYIQVTNTGRTINEGNNLVHRNLDFIARFKLETKN